MNDLNERLRSLPVKILEAPLEKLQLCTICPRNCGANRFTNKLGYCKTNTSYFISSICVHRGEEPPITGKNGICNVFFGHCNLQCVYCQNHQISFNKNRHAARNMTLAEVLAEIIGCLSSGCHAVGFVSPSHFVPQCEAIVNGLHYLGVNPVIVYNTNGYDKPETLHEIASWVDIYLPDFKYIDPVLSEKYSDAPNYPEVAKKSLAEMYHQKGSTLIINELGEAERGILVRHLVLPGHPENSIGVLKYIAHEISTSLHISLMSQYHPTSFVRDMAPINRTIVKNEYESVVEAFYQFGFRKGWIQDLESFENYNPDFGKKHPFED